MRIIIIMPACLPAFLAPPNLANLSPSPFCCASSHLGPPGPPPTPPKQPWKWKLWEPTRRGGLKAVPTRLHSHAVWSRMLKCGAESYVIGSSTKWLPTRPWPWKLWEPTRRGGLKAVPTRLQSHVLWSWMLKCGVKSYVAGPKTKWLPTRLWPWKLWEPTRRGFKGRPNMPPKSCSVVMDAQVWCEVVCDQALNQMDILMDFLFMRVPTRPWPWKLWEPTRRESKGRPNTSPKSCGVKSYVAGPPTKMLFQWIFYSCGYLTRERIELNQWLWVCGVPWSPGFVLGLTQEVVFGNSPSDHETWSVQCRVGIRVDFTSILHSHTPLVPKA